MYLLYIHLVMQKYTRLEYELILFALPPIVLFIRQNGSLPLSTSNSGKGGPKKKISPKKKPYFLHSTEPTNSWHFKNERGRQRERERGGSLNTTLHYFILFFNFVDRKQRNFYYKERMQTREVIHENKNTLKGCKHGLNVLWTAVKN